MDGMSLEPLERLEVDAAMLVSAAPPRWVHGHKRAVAAKTCPPGAVHRGTLRYSRWPAWNHTTIRLSSADIPLVDVHQGVMDYREDPSPSGVPEQHWQMNFADGELFAYYGSSLLAQDEWQVMEHPVLGALREYLQMNGYPTRISSGPQDSCVCTPVLVGGVERRCCFTASVHRHGRAVAMYGRRFAAADINDVLEAVELFDPPPISNILALAAPACGAGAYTPGQIGGILAGCAAGFGACAQHAHASGAHAVINTGFWGCGAFGGNRVLMVALQILAAGAAGVSRLRVFSMDGQGLSDIASAQRLVCELLGAADQQTGPELVRSIVARKMAWGQSDGN